MFPAGKGLSRRPIAWAGEAPAEGADLAVWGKYLGVNFAHSGDVEHLIRSMPRSRAAYDLPQEGFAAMVGISIGTLRNWEQGRRDPEGSARVLLMVAEKHPEALLDVVQAAQRSR